MFFFFGFKLAASSNPIYYEDFMNTIWEGHSKKIAEFEEKRFVIKIQQVSDRTNLTGKNITTIFMTPSEYDFCKDNLDLINESSILPTDEVKYVKIIKRHRRAKMAAYAYESQSTSRNVGSFWIPFVICIVSALTLLGSYLLWACDRYENEPANSLIFATEGQKLVSGN